MVDQQGGSAVWASGAHISLSGWQHYKGGRDALYGGVFALYDFSSLLLENVRLPLVPCNCFLQFTDKISVRQLTLPFPSRHICLQDSYFFNQE